MKKLGCLLLAITVLFTVLLAACNKNEGVEKKVSTSESFALSYFDGMDIDTYDTSLLWRNTSYVLNDGGGDSGVLWVDPEDDPVNGGYFYMYTSGSSAETEDGQSPTAQTGPKAYDAWLHCYRSKDLLDWEACGAVNNTYCMKIYEDGWVESYMFAPECTYAYNPVLGKMQYYLYFSARSKTNTKELQALGAKYSSKTTENYFDRFYLSCAVSDSPCGPFELASSELVYGDANQPNENGVIISDVNPVFLTAEECSELWMTDELRAQGKEEFFSAIDISPFWDNGELYIYFCRHFGDGGPDGSTIWGVHMKDPISPDWETLTMLLGNSYTTMMVDSDWVDPMENSTQHAKFVRVEYKGETQCDPNYPRYLSTSYTRYTRYEDGTESDDPQREYNLIEAPSMVKSKDAEGRDIYCLMYAPVGVSDFNYNVKLSVGYSPLGPFTKVNESDGATVLGVDGNVNDFMSNLGHVQFVTVDDELWIAHYQQQAPFGGVDQGRPYALSSCSLQFNEHLQMYLPVANGPTTSLQPLPSVATGYRNVASEATVKATNAKGDTTKYLTDGMWVTRSTNADKEFKADKSTTITLTFDDPKYVRGLLVYNSYTYANAFKNISQIVFELDETPEWHNGEETKCYINNLAYNDEDYRLDLNNGAIYQTGSAAIATFNELKVKKITIVINNSDMTNPGDELRVSDIVVLGKDTPTLNQGTLNDTYDFEYNRPYAGEPDDFMKVDGVLDEEAWNDCVFTENKYNDVTLRTSTYFTTKGVYIALQGFSKNIEYAKRFTDRTAFHVIVCKTGTITYQDDAYESFGNDHAFKFDCDAYFTRSHCRIPYYYNAVVDGVLNSGNTTSLTAELFLTWEDLYYTEEELTNGGAPESIQVYASFGGTQILGTCSWRLETYPHFGANGYLGDVNVDEVGSVENGPQSTDQWYENKDGNLTTRAGRTQLAWIEDSYSSDFKITATLKAEQDVTFRGNKVYGNMGLCFMAYNGSYTMYMVDASEVEGNGNVVIKTAREIDTFHWINQIGYNETVQRNGITNNTIELTLIKRGQKFYYAYNGIYYDAETLSDSFLGSGWVGFYTSSGMQIVDYTFEDYSKNTNALDIIIKNFIYEVNTPQKTVRGSIYADNSSVKQGEPITLHIRPNAGYILTALALNGDNGFYNTVLAGLDENSNYTFIPTDDVNITATFTAIPKAALVDAVIAFRDANNNSLIDATYQIRTNNALIYYDQTTSPINAKGNVIIKLLKAGTYEIGGKNVVFDGNYEITLKVNEYRDNVVPFTLNDATTSTSLEGANQSVQVDKKYTLIMHPVENMYGTLKVNGSTPVWYGKLNLDTATGDYYVDHDGVFAYFKDKVAETQKATVTINFSQMEYNAATDPIAGVAITSGSQSIVFKINREHSTDRMMIAVGSTSVTYYEYAIGGIPSSIGNQEGEFKFTLVKLDNAIYFIDCNNILKFKITSSGIEFYNGCGQGWGWEEGNVKQINAYYKSFFAKGDESALGVVNYNSGGKVSWHFEYDNNDAEVRQYVQDVKDYEILYQEVAWVSELSKATYRSWEANFDYSYVATNPGTGGPYTSYFPKKITKSDKFTYTVKIECSNLSVLYAGIGCFSDGGGLMCGVGLRYKENNLRLEMFRYVTPEGSTVECDWPYLDLGENSVVADGVFYMSLTQDGWKTSIAVGDSLDTMTTIASLEDDWIKSTVQSFIPGLYVRGEKDKDTTKVKFSEVTYKAN